MDQCRKKAKGIENQGGGKEVGMEAGVMVGSEAFLKNIRTA